MKSEPSAHDQIRRLEAEARALRATLRSEGVLVSARLDPAVHRRLKRLAESRGEHIADLAALAIQRLLNGEIAGAIESAGEDQPVIVLGDGGKDR